MSGHASVGIKEAWLIKGLRLLHSPKPEDGARLRRFYKEACENEAQVLRTTLAEALREHKEDVGERARPRISAPSSLGATELAPTVIGHQQCLQTASASSSDQSDSGSTQSQGLLSLPPSKRQKVGFFNMFDPGSSATSGSNPGISLPVEAGKYRPTTVVSTAKVPVNLVTTAEVITLPDGGVFPMPGTSVETTTLGSEATIEAVAAATAAAKALGPDGADVMADLVADLACRVCRRLTAAVTDITGNLSVSMSSVVGDVGNANGSSSNNNNNAMIECSACAGLFHQLCHSPPILGRMPISALKTWVCSACSSTDGGDGVCEAASTLEIGPVADVSNPTPLVVITPPSASRRKRSSPSITNLKMHRK